MIDNIRRELKEDIWKIIDNKEIEEKKINDYVLLIFYLFLEKESFTMSDVLDIAKKLKEAYDSIFTEARKITIEGDPIKGLKIIDWEFNNKIKPLLKKLCK